MPLILTEIRDPRVSELISKLRNVVPTAAWHATGVGGGWRLKLDTRTHKYYGPEDLREKLQGIVYREPGLNYLLGYTRSALSAKDGATRFYLSRRDSCPDTAVALVTEDGFASAVVMYGITEEAFNSLRHTGVWDGDDN